MGSAVHTEGARRSNGHKGNSEQARATAPVNRLEDQFAAMSFQDTASAANLSRAPEMFAGPIHEVARELRTTLRGLIQDHPLADNAFGFVRGGADGVSVAPLLDKLSRWEARLESVIQKPGALPPELGPLRILAIGLQANLEMFALVLRSSASDGEISNSQMPHVMEQAINLKAEAGITTAKIDAVIGSSFEVH